MPLTYAIDFGTSNSLLGAADQDKPVPPIPLDPTAVDPTVMRTLLYFPSQNKVFYGAQALSKYVENYGEGRLIRSIKKHLPMRSFIGTYIEDRPFNLEDLIGFFLHEMRKRANRHFNQDVDRVILGRPARFSPDDAEDRFAQDRLEIAAKKAGFKFVDFLPEPIAAACEFRQTLREGEEKIVFVGDFGGGTSDFTVMKMRKGLYNPSDVLSIGGVAKAGDALDGSVMRCRVSEYFGSHVAFQVPFSSNVLKMPAHLIDKICSPADISVLMKRDVMEFLKNVEKWAKTEQDKEKMKHLFTLIEDGLGFSLFEAIEKSKKELSKQNSAPILFDYPGVKINESMQRTEFEQYIQSQVKNIFECMDETIQAAGIKYENVDLVCMTGGTAYVPAIREELVKRFGKEKIQERKHFHSVVEGLVQRAQEL